LVEGREVTFVIAYRPSDLRPFILRGQRRTMLFTAAFIFTALFLLYVVASHYLIESVPSQLRGPLVGFLLGVPLLSVVINLISVERMARSRAGRGPCRLTANETGVSYAEEHRTARFEWSAYKRDVERKNSFVFTTATGGLLVPKRCFGSPEQVDIFRDLARNGMNDSFYSG